MRNSRKTLTISLSPFASFCIFPASKEKANVPPFLLLLQPATPQNVVLQKYFLKINYFTSYCFPFLSVVFTSQVSFHAVPTASCKDQEKYLLHKHQEKLGLILLFCYIMTGRQQYSTSMWASVEARVRKGDNVWEHWYTEFFCPIYQYFQILTYYRVIIQTWDVYLNPNI